MLYNMLFEMLDKLSSYSVNPNLYKIGLIFIDFTGAILLIAVGYKFFEYYLKKQKIQKKKGSLFSTAAMTFLVLFMVSFWVKSIGQFNIQDRTLQYIYFIFGIFLCISGIIWHIKSKIDIGRFWSDEIEIKENHEIIQSGAYKYARHPMYASLLLWCWGAGFIMFNYITFLITTLCFLPLMIKRAHSEEKELIETNIDYNLYKENTKMLNFTLKDKIALLVKLLALAVFVYFIITGINLQNLMLLFFIHFYLGYSLTPEKVAFSYRSKSFIIIVVWLISRYGHPVYYFYYVVALMLLYGLKWNCPCMAMYEKFGGCPCIKLFKNIKNRPNKNSR